MKINNVSPNLVFKRNLTPTEMAEYKEVLKQAREKVGQTGKSIFIMPSSCLPQTESFNSGVGSLSSDIAQEYLGYMKDYLDFNMVEDLPPGQINPVKGFNCAYNSSGFALGLQQINPELLTKDEFGKLLTTDELKKIVETNTIAEKDCIANYKNVAHLDGSQNKILKKAFERFEKLDESNELKTKFKDYVKENQSWLDFPRKGEDNQEFFKFKQFLADEHLKIGKKRLNDKGIKLCGDCLISFSFDEIRAFPNAFKTEHFIGMPEWGIRSLNYDNILDETNDAAKVLKQKVQLFAKRYDAIRFDVGWAYVSPVITPKGEKHILNENRKEFGDSLLKLIEKWVKEVKGEDFDLNNLMYEFAADPDAFRAFENGKIIPPLKNRVKIYESTYMHDLPDKWGFNEAYLERGWKPEEFVVGVGNHDPQPLRQIAKNIPEKIVLPNGSIIEESHKKDAVESLSRILKISKEILENPIEFAKAKWAEPMLGYNNMMFYMDVFGREERFDMQGLNTKIHPEKNYAYKIPTDFKKAYQDSIREGFGFNPMDALEKCFKAKGLDQQHPELYEKIIKYNKILQEPEKNITSGSKLGKIITAVIAVIAIGSGIFYTIKQQQTKNAQQQHI